MVEKVRHAQCMCGAVKAETSGEPWRVIACSCLDCRRKSGSAYAVSTYWDAEVVKLSGDVRSWQRAAQDGRKLVYHFCPVCGITLYWNADFAGNRIGIGAGNFEDCEFAIPEKAYWTEGRPEWATDIRHVPTAKRQ